MTKIEIENLLGDIEYNNRKAAESLGSPELQAYALHEHVRTTNNILTSILKHLAEGL